MRVRAAKGEALKGDDGPPPLVNSHAASDPCRRARLHRKASSTKSSEDDAHCRLSLRSLRGKYDREEQGGRPVILQCEGCHAR